MSLEIKDKETESYFCYIQSKSVCIGTISQMSVAEPSLLFSPTSYSYQVTLIDYF
jgi:hypothetical protein